MFAAHTMRFLAVGGASDDKEYFGSAVGEVLDTTFGYDNRQQTSEDLFGGRSIAPVARVSVG